MLERFVQLIYEYQSKVKEAILLFDRYKVLNQPRHPLEWQASGIPQTGYLDTECLLLPQLLTSFDRYSPSILEYREYARQE
jgi:hypothetical protein